MPSNAMILSAVPAHLPAPLRTSLAEARKATKAVDPKALAVMLNETLALWPQPAEFQTTAKFYREALADVPHELVEKALRHVRLTSKFFPKPAEIREAIAKDLDALRKRRWELEKQAREWCPPETPVSKAERQKVGEMFARLSKCLKRMDTHPMDLQQ